VTAENQRHLANTMRHSDVVVNVASTLAIPRGNHAGLLVRSRYDGERVRTRRRGAVVAA